MAWIAKIQYYTGLFQPNMHEIMPGLWLGNIASAYDKTVLQQHDITHILCITGHGIDVAFYTQDFKYCVLTADDNVEQPISLFFDTSNNFIKQAMSQKHNVLVHCMFGRSRSATLVAAFLIQHMHFTPMAAFAYLRMKRPVVCPNPGFITQTYHWAMDNNLFYRNLLNK
jgi:protein-tyrosine phosphatase